jgi:RNA-directed DNA polymerase
MPIKRQSAYASNSLFRSNFALTKIMNWESYENEFKFQAFEKGFDETYYSTLLEYAFKLFNKKLPIIYDLEHFSLLVGYDSKYVQGAYYETPSFYRYYTIKKRSGGLREISEPLPSLKEIQRWILDNILYQCPVSKFAKGFVPQKSIRENARFHRNQSKVLSLDIENFFPSIKGGKIYNFFSSLGYQDRVSHLLTKLCTLNGSLPQGSPTSPAISNLINIRLDNRLSGFALKEKVRYTRYADDITYSGNFDEGRLINFTRKVLLQEGYKLNEKKTRLMQKHQRQEVTGIVVNEKLHAPKTTRRELRQKLYYIKKYGIDSHIQFNQIGQANYVKHLLGIANFILFVNPKDVDVKEYISYLHEILKLQ